VQFWSLFKEGYSSIGGSTAMAQLISGMRGLSYDEGLSNMSLYSLEFRRMRGDLIEFRRDLIGSTQSLPWLLNLQHGLLVSG